MAVAFPAVPRSATGSLKLVLGREGACTLTPDDGAVAASDGPKGGLHRQRASLHRPPVASSSETARKDTHAKAMSNESLK